MRPRCARAASARCEKPPGTGGRCCSVFTTRVADDVDPSAVVFASRAAGEDWFCFEQPDRDGSALAALGTVARLTASGPRPLPAASPRDWRELTAGAVADAPDGPPGAGLVALGGFAFAPDGGRAPHWTGFAAADLVVPEVALARRGDDVRLTLAALAAPDDVAGGARRAPAGARRRAAPRRRCRCSTPRPPAASGSTRVAPPEHYEAAVARAVERIRAGAFEKIVLAREVTVHAPTAARRRRGLRRPARAASSPATSSAPAAATPRSWPPRPELLIRRDGAARADRRARRLDPPLRRPRRRRPPRRAAAALRQGPRGAGDRRPPDRPRAAPARRLGRRRPTSRR